MTVFLLLVLAHLIADFITQTSYMNQEKHRFSSLIFSKWLLYHCLHHLGISFLLIIIFIEWREMYLIMIPLITLIHYFIDVGKIKWQAWVKRKTLDQHVEKRTWYSDFIKKSIPPFMLDQLVHVTSIYLVLNLFGNRFSISELGQLFSLDIYLVDSQIRLFILMILFVLVTYPAAYFISMLLSDFDHKIIEPEIAATLEQENEQIEKIKDHMNRLETDVMITESFQEEAEHYSLQVQYRRYSQAKENRRGRYIGILERVLIVILVVQNLYQGLALIIAMKTLTRFKQFDDKSFAEYYLIGTLLSLIIGIVFAEVIKQIWVAY